MLQRAPKGKRSPPRAPPSRQTRLKKRRRTARDEENDGEVARLTVYIIFEKRMRRVAEKMIKVADPKRRARRQADLLGLWLDRDAALDDPLKWVRLRKS